MGPETNEFSGRTVAEVTLEAVVIRKDGTREDLGMLSRYRPGRINRALALLGKFLARYS